MATFERKRQSLPLKKERLVEITNELKLLEQNKAFSTDDIKKRSSLKTELANLKSEIQKIEDNSEIKDYYCKTADILLNYYSITSGAFYNVECNDEPEQKNNVETNETEICDVVTETDNNDAIEITEEVPERIETTGMSTISDKLIQLNLLSQSKRKVKKPVKKRKIIYETSSSAKSILSFFGSVEQEIKQINTIQQEDFKPNVNRATLQDKYLMLVDKNYACDHVKGCTLLKCTTCLSDRVLFQSDGLYVCLKCGECEHAMIESEVPSHKDAINDKPKYPYKKLNHLKEKLNQLQSKETADIPESVFDTIKKELKKKREFAKNTTPSMIKDILKKYKLVECYEHLQQIYCKISGAQPVTLSRETEEKVINMFNTMQESYQKHRPDDRSNFGNKI